MNKLNILHVTVHLGGGVGKAIVGMILSSNPKITNEIVLLEEPIDTYYVSKLVEKKITFTVSNQIDVIINKINTNDIVIFDWWAHPLMIKIMLELPTIKCRAVLWSHVNGCSYPFLDISFLNCFTHVFFTSEYSLENEFWTDEEKKKIKTKSTVIYGIGNFSPESIVQKQYEKKSGITIGYVGTINYSKMNRRILDYYEAAVREFGDIKIIMLGKPSSDFLDEIKSKGMQEFFVFPGYVEDVFRYYAEMDCFAYFLNSESYATTENALIEAMAIGLPIVVLNNPVERHIIVDGVNGVLINNKVDFLSFLKWIIEEKNAQELGNRTRDFCIKKYSQYRNSKLFYDSCYFLLGNKKDYINFSEAVGTDVYNAFKKIAFLERDIIDEIMQEANKNTLEGYGLPEIYFGKDKSSVFQFVRYFPDDYSLRRLEMIIKDGN